MWVTFIWRSFEIIQDFIPLFFFMYVQILWQGQKAVLTIVEFEFFDIFYSKFQLLSKFSICSKFCVENWLLCCEMICKLVTCSSECKRFWKSALHLLAWYYDEWFEPLITSCADFSYVIQFFWFPNLWKWMVGIVTLYLHISFAKCRWILSLIRTSALSIPIRHHRLFTVNFTMLKKQ